MHFNSGINNKAAYLLTDGDTFNGYTVNGLGIAKVADIYYEAQTNLLTSGSDYADLHAALNQACQNLVGTAGITSNDCLEVQAAVNAVEMGTDPLNFHPEADVCVGGEPPNDLFFDDLESGSSQWNFVNLAGDDPTPAWLRDFGYAASGDFMLWGRDSLPGTDGIAEMNVDVPLPAGTRSYLHFRHSFGFEVSVDLDTFELIYWDGGFLEYSTDGGNTWSDAGPLIDSGQLYNATIANDPVNPHANRAAFGAESHGYVSSRVDLSGLTGQSIRFRWHTSTDAAVGGPFGWVVDDVRVYTCDNEPPPPAIVEFSDPAYVVDESGIAATITVSRTGGADTAFSIDYAAIDLSATAGDDYIATAGTLNFAEGQNTRTFDVPILDDTLSEGNEAVVLRLSGGSGADLGAVSQATLTINDNDNNDVAWLDDDVPEGATPSGSWNWVTTGPTPYSGSQAHQSDLAAGLHQHFFTNAPPLQIQTGDTLYAYVYLDPLNPPSEVMLQWRASNGSWEHRAYWGEDLINWGVNGAVSRRYMGPLPPTGQWVRLEVPASLVGLEGIPITGMAFTLFDGRATWDTAGTSSTPPFPEVAFSDATYSVGEAGPVATITVSRTGNPSGSVTVDYATADGSAVAGIDYTATAGTLSFADGEDTQTFDVPILEDSMIESNETINLALSAPSGANLGATSNAVLSITDNDNTEVAWFDDALPTGAVGFGGWNWINTAPVPFSGALAHQSALAPGLHQHYFTSAAEPLQPKTGDTVYIYAYLDPDNPPSELMLQWQVAGSWEQRAYWGANLIAWGVDGTASRRYMGPLPATGQWTRLEVPASAVGLEGVSVTGMAFTLFDGRVTFDAVGVSSTPPAPEVAFSEASFNVSEGGGVATISVSRSGSTSGSVTVDYATADNSATAGLDYVATNGTLTFADGEASQTFDVAILEDGLIEPNESVDLTLSNANGANLGTAFSALLTITDNDNNDFAWFDDAVPGGAVTFGVWDWVSTAPAPFSGGLAHQSALLPGLHQHYFTNAGVPLQVQTGDTLYVYAYLDPDDPPSEVMLQWQAAGSWEHRAYWGADLINWGINDTPSRRYMGPLPATGQWVRLEIPANAVGLEGAAITGMAFTLFDGRVTWDVAGVSSTPPAPEVAFSEAAYGVGEDGVEAIITVSRTGSTSGSATVDYTTADGSATAGLDYTAVSGTLVFADGETDQTFTVPILEDGLIESNETIDITLSGASGASLGGLSSAVLTISDNDNSDVIWFDDALPTGARPFGVWDWISTAPIPYAGSLAHQSQLAGGLHQHYFTSATDALQVQTGDTLYVYAYLDPANPPSEVMLQWQAFGSWEQRAYWGANSIPWGVDGTNSRRYMGPLPATGQWVRLEVPASEVGLEGVPVTGMAFTLFDGRVTWDETGRSSQ